MQTIFKRTQIIPELPGFSGDSHTCANSRYQAIFLFSLWAAWYEASCKTYTCCFITGQSLCCVYSSNTHMKAACVPLVVFWDIQFGVCGYLYLYVVTEKVVYCLCSCGIVHPGDGGVCPTHECLRRAPTQAKPHVLVCSAAGIDDSPLCFDQSKLSCPSPT